MSYNPIKLNVVPTIDPRININNERVFSILKGGSQITYSQNISTSYSQNTMNFTATPPSDKTLVCSSIFLDMYITINFTGTSTSGNLLQLGTYDGVASFPGCKAINTLTIQLNNTPISYNYSDIFPHLFRYEQCLELNRNDLTGTSDMLDSHNDLNFWISLGSARNPLAFYGENSARISRGGFAGLEIISNTPTAASVRIRIIEPLFIPGILNWNDEKLTSSLVGLSTNDYIFTMNNNPKNIWSHGTSSPNTITDINIIYNDIRAPQLLFSYITVDYMLPIPSNVVYPYAQIDRYQNTIGVLTPGQTTTITLNNIQLKSIPKCLYIFARESNQYLSEVSTDCFAGISNISVDWNNRSSILASATQFDLWKISRKNGLNLSYSEFIKYVGSPICLMIDEDIGCGSNVLDVSGVAASSSYQLQIRATVNNIFNRNVHYTFYVITINDGTASIMSNGSTLLSTNVVSKDDVYNALSDSGAYEDYGYYKTMTGRGFLKDVGNAIKLTNRFYNKKVIPAMHGVARSIEKTKAAGEDIIGAIGSGVVGGAALTRNQLKENMRRL